MPVSVRREGTGINALDVARESIVKMYDSVLHVVGRPADDGSRPFSFVDQEKQCRGLGAPLVTGLCGDVLGAQDLYLGNGHQEDPKGRALDADVRLPGGAKQVQVDGAALNASEVDGDDDVSAGRPLEIPPGHTFPVSVEVQSFQQTGLSYRHQHAQDEDTDQDFPHADAV